MQALRTMSKDKVDSQTDLLSTSKTLHLTRKQTFQIKNKTLLQYLWGSEFSKPWTWADVYPKVHTCQQPPYRTWALFMIYYLQYSAVEPVCLSHYSIQLDACVNSDSVPHKYKHINTTFSFIIVQWHSTCRNSNGKLLSSP